MTGWATRSATVLDGPARPPPSSDDPAPEHSAAVDLAPDADRALAEFLEHLRLERGRSRTRCGPTWRPHRAARRAARAAGPRSRRLRGWLADAHAAGAARSTLARKAAAARTFTAWAHRRGLLPGDPGARLVAPRPRSALPTVLDREQAAAVLDATGSRAGPDDPVAIRDRLVVELLYATGMRVAELCGLDLDDVDEQRRALRVVGKGDRERTVVYGVPAGRALRVWRDVGRLPWPDRGRRPRCCSVRAEAASTRGSPVGWCTGPWRPSRTSPTSARTAFGTRRRRTCSTAARTFVTYRSCSVTLSYRRLSSTRSHRRAAEGGP